MDEKRMRALLNQIIDHVAVARNTSETVSELCKMGFTGEELSAEFGFSQADVEECEATEEESEA